jgi:predicted nucleotidyltransferase
MRPSEALEQRREAIRELVPLFRACNPRVFGSVLRGLDEETSDLDILVDTQPGTTLFDLGGLQEQLRGLLGVRVDVRTPGDLPLAFREAVIAEAKPV